MLLFPNGLPTHIDESYSNSTIYIDDGVIETNLIISGSNITLLPVTPWQTTFTSILYVTGDNNYIGNFHFDKGYVRNEGLGTDITFCNFINSKDCSILSSGDNAEISYNNIVDFYNDAIRVAGDNTRIVCNNISNILTSDESHHHDAIQMYAGNKSSPLRSAERYEGKHILKNIVIKHNTIINSNNKANNNLQGITFFDGFIQDITVADNYIEVTTNHAITFNGLLVGNNDIRNNNIVNLQTIKINPAREIIQDKFLDIFEGWRDNIGCTVRYDYGICNGK